LSLSSPLALFNGSYIDNKPSGIGVVARELANSLDNELVKVLSPIGISSSREIPIPNNLSPINGTKGHLRRLIWTQNKLPEIIKQVGADFLISPLPEAPIFKSVRSIVLVHDLLPLRYPQLTPLLSYHLIYVPLVVHNSVRVLCNSNATAHEIHKRLKVPLDKLITIPLGYDSKKLYPLNLKRSSFFLVLGRHDPHKNISRIIKAFSFLKSDDIELWFVGTQDKRYTPRLKALASDLGISHRCRWIPWVSDQERLRLLNSCQGLVIASLWEGFGLPVIEAMACETPVIASNRGALPEVVGDAGFLVDPFDPMSIYDAMRELIDNQLLVNKLIQKGKKRITKYKWENAAKRIEDLIKDL